MVQINSFYLVLWILFSSRRLLYSRRRLISMWKWQLRLRQNSLFFQRVLLYMELDYRNQAILCAARCFTRFIAFNDIEIIHLISDWWFMFMILTTQQKLQPCSTFACHHNNRSILFKGSRVTHIAKIRFLISTAFL